MCFNSVLSVLYVHVIVVTRRIALDKFNVLILCIDVLFLSFLLVFACMLIFVHCFGHVFVSRR